MRGFRVFLVLALLVTLPLFAGVGSRTAVADETVRICDDDAEWAPFIYYSRKDGKIDKSEIAGATVELFEILFRRLNLPYRITLDRWKRCLFEVARFAERGVYEVVTNASYTPQRAQDYYASAPLYHTRFGIAYSTKRFPDGLHIGDLAQLRDHQLCGPHGYNVGMYGLSAEDVDSSNKDYVEILKRVSLGRCEIGLIGVEVVRGVMVLNDWQPPEDVVMQALPQIKPTSFHIWVSKGSPRALRLITDINQVLIEMQNDGTSDGIFARYLD